jgi:hypothetical protein
MHWFGFMDVCIFFNSSTAMSSCKGTDNCDMARIIEFIANNLLSWCRKTWSDLGLILTNQ